MVDTIEDPWVDDRLNYKALGETYTNLIKSIDDSKVISIEAGFGLGKTFFRKAWAQHLRNSGEVVIEIDAQKSDHSGDPVVTFIGALVAECQLREKALSEKAKKGALKWGGVAARGAATMVLRSAASEIIEDLTESALDKLEDMETLEQIVSEFGEGISKAAGRMIAAQLAAEKIRQKEMPEQLNAMREALTEKAEANRIVILIDELDRCHPEYAIALLEAMKVVFDQPGYVFVLLVNADYLENLASNRFGLAKDGEKYLDKFVDLRFKLLPSNQAKAEFAREIALALPEYVPFNGHAEFSIERVGQLAFDLTPRSKLTIRQIKRVLLKVEVALRCYAKEPVDCALLVFLAFSQAIEDKAMFEHLPKELTLRRSNLTPVKAAELIKNTGEPGAAGRLKIRSAVDYISENCPELVNLPLSVYGVQPAKEGYRYNAWSLVLGKLAPEYIPRHQAILDAVQEIVVSGSNIQPE